MKIKIAHLYYDLMNLYGENGNVRALKNHFEKQDIKVDIDLLTINDKIDFDKYDIFYMGMGTEEYQLLVLNDMKKRKENIVKAIKDKKYFFITGNSIELFGKYIEDMNGNKIETLNIFPYYTKQINSKNENNLFRIVGDTLGTSKLINEDIIGFQNRGGTIHENTSPFLTLKYGTGSSIKDNFEGYTFNNFYATYLIGPLFIRNPYLTDYFVKRIVNEKDPKYKFKIFNNTNEIKAYNNYINILQEKNID